mmetsp:Transcript_14900/g.24417  ORF Transcript_14900/g.24417 Transcript_14900/m.24417 type:complete len:161 (+) Transcript_14900:235-717(+)
MLAPSFQASSNSHRAMRRSSTGPILQHSKNKSMSQPKVRRRTSFTTIEIREYEQCLGDCPATQAGAPIQLSWNYEEKQSISLDEYEEARKPRRRRSELILGVMERRQKLLSAGSSFLEVIHAERAVALKNGFILGMSRQNDNKKQSKSLSKQKSVTPRAA